MIRMQDDANPAQLDFAATFAPLLAGLNSSVASTPVDVPYSSLTASLDPAFPYGFRRGFYGPQIAQPTVAFLQSTLKTFTAYINDALAAGEFPATALWGLQYTKPMPSALPKTAAATAWPHNVAGYQTLFSPSQQNAKNDGLIQTYTNQFTTLVYALQREQGVDIKDYPNYISPKQTTGMSKVVKGVSPAGTALAFGEPMSQG